MNYTNKRNLPQALVDLVVNDDYTKGDAELSVTQLLKPMRAVVLELKFSNQITVDVSDRIWAVYGKLVHKLLHEANKDKAVTAEERYYVTVRGIKLSGGMDHIEFDRGHILDWKFTTVWKFLKGKPTPIDYERQLNIYAELLRVNGSEVNSLEIVGLLRDFSKTEAFGNDDYPQFQVERMPIPLWDRKKVRQYMVDRVEAYKAALINPPHCTDDERWMRNEKWAVTKLGAKKAVRLLNTASDADAFAKEKGAGFVVTHRPGENLRCKFYCDAKTVCAQAKELGVV